MTDSELVMRTRLGERSAFDELVLRHQAVALALAIKIVGNREQGQEICQEALLDAYLSLDSLRNPDHFRAWLCGIVVNRSKNFLRRRRLGTLSFEILEGGRLFDSLPFVAKEPSPAEIAESREIYQQVSNAVAELSLPNQRAVLLYYFEELSVREVAALLQISVPAVKGRLYKSRQQLRFLLRSLLPAPSKKEPVYKEFINQHRRTKMIPVSVADVVVPNPESQHHVVILLDEDGRRILPIWIGHYEATSIAMHLLKTEVKRPMTFDFMAGLLNKTGLQIESVAVSKIAENTFYATVTAMNQGDSFEIDARPSDAISLAVRTDSPIFVSDDVMESTGEEIPAEIDVKSVAQGQGMRDVVQAFEQLQEEQHRHREKDKEKTSEERQKEARESLLTFVFGMDT